MFTRLLKIQIIILSIFTQIAAAQTNNVIQRFNEYLRITHLNSLINATSFSGPQTIRHSGPGGEVSISNVNLLTLMPDSSFNGPLEFAAAWKNLQEKLDDKQNIYWQLFFKLAEFSGQRPQSLAILITTDKPRIYSILIYYHGGIKIDRPASEIKGGSSFKIITDPGKDFANCKYIQHQPYSEGLTNKLADGIAYFITKTPASKPGKNPDYKIEDNNYVIFEVNSYGRIIPKSYEEIELFLSIGPPAKDGSVNIGYNFSVHFGSEQYSKKLEDGLHAHTTEMARFNSALADLIQNIAKVNEQNK